MSICDVSADVYQRVVRCSASRGIGLSIVQKLLRSPDNIVFAACRNPSSAVALNALGNAPKCSESEKLHVVQMDITDQASISRAKSEVESILGNASLDYLINNVGIVSTCQLVPSINRHHMKAFKNDTPSTLDPKDLTVTIAANVAGPTLVTRTFMPLVERGNRKVITNISSSATTGIDYGGQHSSYSISKAAPNTLVRESESLPLTSIS